MAGTTTKYAQNHRYGYGLKTNVKVTTLHRLTANMELTGSPYGRHHDGVTVPEVELPRPLTQMEFETLPDPTGLFSNVINVYYHQTIVVLTAIFENI
ncbi:hypothetical protein ILYODFUR_034819 [Ilyodon furcidens]|uniref:Uncharacterized protein n=1 Tax=Ilyodon furcidens TaxID=33524 RepID=A0ABV0UQL0_9TELE